MSGKQDEIDRLWRKLQADWHKRREREETLARFPCDRGAFEFLQSFVPGLCSGEVEMYDILRTPESTIVYSLIRDYMAKDADEDFLLACLRSDKIVVAYACMAGMNRAPKGKRYSEEVIAQAVANAVVRLGYFLECAELVPETTKRTYVSILDKYGTGTDEEILVLERMERVEGTPDPKYKLPTMIVKVLASLRKKRG